MKYFNDFLYDIEQSEITSLVKQAAERAGQTNDPELLKTMFGLMDLTSLSEKDNASNIGRMCDKVNLLADSYPDLPSVAAICVYPEWVATVKSALKIPLVNIASVGAGFPASQTFLEVKEKEVKMAISAGADEIDIVISVGKFLAGDYETAHNEIATIKKTMGAAHLKVILETASLPDLKAVRKASMLSMDAGADFIKTSTGKASEGANPESFAVMCLAIKDFYSKTGKKIGIKPAGGISSERDALVYYFIVEKVLGEAWLNAELFRIGASRLADVLIRKIHGKDESFSWFK